MWPDEISFSIARGAAAASFAGELWRLAPERHRRATLWNCPLAGRRELLMKLAETSPLCGLFHYGNEPAGICWLEPAANGARATSAHFMVIRRGGEGVGREFIQLSGFDCLLGFIPMPYRMARTQAKAAGFVSMAILPGACWLWCRQRLVDGELLIWKRHG